MSVAKRSVLLILKLIVVGMTETSVDKLVLLLRFIFILLLNLNIL
nr:MAG: hypothetical protein [Prevotella phage R001]